jgi:hypothetical protein
MRQPPFGTAVGDQFRILFWFSHLFSKKSQKKFKKITDISVAKAAGEVLLAYICALAICAQP